MLDLTKCNIHIIQMYVTVTQDDAKTHCSNLNLSLGVSNLYRMSQITDEFYIQSELVQELCVQKQTALFSDGGKVDSIVTVSLFNILLHF